MTDEEVIQRDVRQPPLCETCFQESTPFLSFEENKWAHWIVMGDWEEMRRVQKAYREANGNPNGQMIFVVLDRGVKKVPMGSELLCIKCFRKMVPSDFKLPWLVDDKENP